MQYVLSFFRRAQEYFYGTDKAPGVYRGMGRGANILDFADPMQGVGGFGNHFYLPLFHKQAIIVLREELEYFTIAPKGMARSAVARPPVGNRPPQASEEFAHLKDACGDVLLQRRQIFTALQRNINKENNIAEQHLIDMLCMSGFEQDDLWGYRAREANRCSITSTAMVLLKTGVTHRGELPEGRAPHQPAPRKPIGVERTGVDPDAGLEPLDTHVSEEQLGEWVDDAQGGSLRVNQHQLNTTQKLLLFWRKPAVRAHTLTAAEMLVGRHRLGGAERRHRDQTAARTVLGDARYPLAAGARMARAGQRPARPCVGPPDLDARSEPGTWAWADRRFERIACSARDTNCSYSIVDRYSRVPRTGAGGPRLSARGGSTGAWGWIVRRGSTVAHYAFMCERRISSAISRTACSLRWSTSVSVSSCLPMPRG